MRRRRSGAAIRPCPYRPRGQLRSQPNPVNPNGRRGGLVRLRLGCGDRRRRRDSDHLSCRQGGTAAGGPRRPAAGLRGRGARGRPAERPGGDRPPRGGRSSPEAPADPPGRREPGSSKECAVARSRQPVQRAATGRLLGLVGCILANVSRRLEPSYRGSPEPPAPAPATTPPCSSSTRSSTWG